MKDIGEEAFKHSLWSGNLRANGRMEHPYGFENAPGVGRVIEDRAKAASPLEFVPARKLALLLRLEKVDLGVEDVPPIKDADFVPGPVQSRQYRSGRLSVKLPEVSTWVKQALSIKVSVAALPHQAGQIPL